MPQKLSWIANEYKHHNHDIKWYAGLFLFGAILVAWGLYSHQIITTILFLLIIFVVYALSNRAPEKVMVELGDKGVVVNGGFYSYSKLKHFWIVAHDGQIPELTFETNSLLNRHLTLQLDDQDTDVVRLFLADYLPEIPDYEENFIDYLIRQLRL